MVSVWTFVPLQYEGNLLGYAAYNLGGGEGYIYEDLSRCLAQALYQAELVDKVREAREEAERASRAKSAFLANMSHEIRTPLNGIIGSMQFASDCVLGEEERRLLKVGQQAAEGLLQTLSSILDFAKFETEHIKLERVPFEPSDLLEDVVGTFEGLIAGREVEMRTVVDDGVPRWLLGDRFRLRQVLCNLISNACKFTPAGRVEVRVELDLLEADDPQVRFEVSDTGIGIPTSKVERIFEAFTQADDSTTRKYGGTGLGLAICDRLVCHMGGRLEVESTVGKGSRFLFYLPLAVPSQRRALVVDSDSVCRLMVQRILQKQGYETEGYAEIQAARSALDMDSCDVVCLELDLEGVAGVLHDARGRCAVVGLSASTGHATEVPVVVKPLQAEALLQAVKRALSLLEG